MLYADRGYDSKVTRWLLRWIGIEPQIARRGTSHGKGLRCTQGLVGRTISWIKGLRRMRVRYDRFGIIRDAWITLVEVVCFRIQANDTL
jgi:IS5 family transposase